MPIPRGAWFAGFALSAVAVGGVCWEQSAKPLAQAIVGTWELWCYAESSSQDECLGRDDTQMFKTFHADGRVSSGSRQGTTLEGRYTLSGQQLSLRFSGGGFNLEENYRARVDNERLMLWSPSRGVGSISAPQGTPFEAADGEVFEAGRVEDKLHGLPYALELPAGYRKVQDSKRRQAWGPAQGEGFVVELSVSPRSKRQVGDAWVTAPCNDYDYGGVSGSSATHNGVEREISIGTSVCLDEIPEVIFCSVEHTRGYLREEEKPDALALCRSFERRR